MTQVKPLTMQQSADDKARANLALIEDDADVAHTVCDGLSSYGFNVTRAASLTEGHKLLTSGSFDAVILDLSLPDGSGLDLARAIRACGSDLPILMLTARDTVYQRVEGFRHGADDYLCKPFDVEELAARIQAILRRANAGHRHILQYGDVELDRISRMVRRQHMQDSLSARETELLSYLMQRPEEILPRERLLAAVWGDEAEEDSNVLNVYINYLRIKLEQAGHPRIIHTIRKRGYMLSMREPDELLAGNR